MQNLIIDNNNITTTGYSTPLISIGTGIITDLTVDTLTDNLKTWRGDELIGIYLNPNINQINRSQTVFPIISNNQTSIVVDSTSYNLTDIAAIGDTYIGEYYFNNISVINGARVKTTDNIFFDSINITGGLLQGNNIYQTGSSWKEPFVKFAGVIRRFFRQDKQDIQDEKTTHRKDVVAVGVSRLASKDVIPAKAGIQTTSNSPLTNLSPNVVVGEGDGGLYEGGLKPVMLATTTSDLKGLLPDIRQDKQDENVISAKAGIQKKEIINPVNPVNPVKDSLSAGDPIYTYDLNGNRLTMTDPTGTTTYTYDALNRLISIKNPKGKITTFTYDALGRRTGMTYANGVKTSYGYDAGGRLLSLLNQIGLSTVSTFSYSYDKVGNRKSMTDKDGAHNYVYDQLYRLIEATHPQPQNPAEQFSYDLVGNRLSSHLSTEYSYDNMNRLLLDNQYDYVYDANGNLIEKVNNATGEAERYSYDAENRLVKYEKFTSAVDTIPVTQAIYQYDGLGRRIAKTVNGVVTKYVYDEKDVLLELDESDKFKARYTRTLEIDDIISVNRDINNDGILDTAYYYHKDGLGSITAMTDSVGGVVQGYVYDSFGEIVQKNGTIENRYTYTSREWDEEAGLYYYRARYYAPGVGRFLNEDPKGFDAGINFYIYAENNPIKYTDPLGLIPFDSDGYCPPYFFPGTITLNLGGQTLIVDYTLSYVGKEIKPINKCAIKITCKYSAKISVPIMKDYPNIPFMPMPWTHEETINKQFSYSKIIGKCHC